MKNLFAFFTLLAFLGAPAMVLAQNMELMETNTTRSKTVSTPAQKQTEKTTSSAVSEFNNFNYMAYLQKEQDYRNRKADEKKLVTADWLLMKKQYDLLNSSNLGVKVEMKGDSVEAVELLVYESSTSPQQDKLDRNTVYQNEITDFKLNYLDQTIKTAKKVNIETLTINAIQVDPIREIKFRNLSSDENYALALLDYIKNLLKGEPVKKALHLTTQDTEGDTVYLKQYEPAGLTLEQQIKNREKFVRYVYSKI